MYIAATGLSNAVFDEKQYHSLTQPTIVSTLPPHARHQASISRTAHTHQHVALTLHISHIASV